METSWARTAGLERLFRQLPWTINHHKAPEDETSKSESLKLYSGVTGDSSRAAQQLKMCIKFTFNFECNCAYRSNKDFTCPHLPYVRSSAHIARYGRENIGGWYTRTESENQGCDAWSPVATRWETCPYFSMFNDGSQPSRCANNRPGETRQEHFVGLCDDDCQRGHALKITYSAYGRAGNNTDDGKRTPEPEYYPDWDSVEDNPGARGLFYY
ncbi:hypothetical protein B0T22DRAFT_444132 [Podospora appendiculata]|uniref:Uncharacterized protein n=1 Tax=Podospora appendiculata TaxID=314037 RepID=A0AAE0X476_9PEZI|nr:hypothetical protein B0T22DRAFT_444132 [Podospora appendiculata]